MQQEANNASKVAQEELKEVNNSGSTTEDNFEQTRMLTNLELISKAESCIDKLQLEKAVSLLDEGLRRFPNDTVIMDLYIDLLIQFGEQDKAKELLERSIQLNPKRDG